MLWPWAIVLQMAQETRLTPAKNRAALRIAFKATPIMDDRVTTFIAMVIRLIRVALNDLLPACITYSH